MLRAWVAVGCVTAVTAVLLPGTANADGGAPTSPYTAMVQHTPKYPEAVATGSAVTVTWRAAVPGKVGESLTFRSPDPRSPTAEVSVHMPDGEQLTAGATYPVGVTVKDVEVTDANRSDNCAPTGGTVTVRQVERDDAGAIVAASISGQFTGRCPGSSVELRYNSPDGWTSWDATVPPADTVSVLATPGPQIVTVTSSGSDPATLGSISVANVISAPTFQVFSLGAGGTCAAGTTLGYGQSCTVEVDRRITVPGSYTGTLSIVDSSGVTRAVPLELEETGRAAGGLVMPNPIRVIDTGAGLPNGPVGPGQTLWISALTGSGWTNADITAVELSVTVDRATADSYLTLYPHGAARPTVSSMTFPKGWSGTSTVTVKVGDFDAVDLYNYAGQVDLEVEVIGWLFNDQGTRYPAAGQYHPHTPVRVADTRRGVGQVPPYKALAVAMDYGAPVNRHVTALAVNVTVVNPHASGAARLYEPTSGPWNAPATVLLRPGVTAANATIAATGICTEFSAPPGCPAVPTIDVYNDSDAGVDVVVDVVGYYDDGAMATGLEFHPVTPTRIVDSRHGSPLTAGGTAAVDVPGEPADAQVVAATLTAVRPTVNTYLTAWPAGTPRPTVSNLNLSAGQVLPNSIQVGLDDLHRFNLYNYAGTTNYLVDVFGYYHGTPTGDVPPTPLPAHILG